MAAAAAQVACPTAPGPPNAHPAAAAAMANPAVACPPAPLTNAASVFMRCWSDKVCLWKLGGTHARSSDQPPAVTAERADRRCDDSILGMQHGT